MNDLFPGFEAGARRVNGVHIHFRTGGSGPPLLLLHGFAQTHALWHRVVPRLAQHFTLVMPDLRGYGDSDKPPGDADHANYGKRTMALDHPQAVARLMLLDVSPTRASNARCACCGANAASCTGSSRRSPTGRRRRGCRSPATPRRPGTTSTRKPRNCSSRKS